jgi:hypothetical protein
MPTPTIVQATERTDSYTCYYGGWQNFPPSSKWVEFDAMWDYTKLAMQSGCGELGINPQDIGEQIGEIWNAIQQIATNSLMDHRFILATIMQESIGCVYVGATTDRDRGSNPGLMQSAGGVSYNPSNSQGSITQMIIDGTQGTKFGDGLVQAINMFGTIYEVWSIGFFTFPQTKAIGRNRIKWLMLLLLTGCTVLQLR